MRKLLLIATGLITASTLTLNAQSAAPNDDGNTGHGGGPKKNALKSSPYDVTHGGGPKRMAVDGGDGNTGHGGGPKRSAFNSSAPIDHQGGPKRSTLSPEQKQIRKEIRLKYDLNQDGWLDQAERAKISAEDKAILKELRQRNAGK